MTDAPLPPCSDETADVLRRARARVAPEACVPVTYSEKCAPVGMIARLNRQVLARRRRRREWAGGPPP